MSLFDYVTLFVVFILIVVFVYASIEVDYEIETLDSNLFDANHERSVFERKMREQMAQLERQQAARALNFSQRLLKLEYPQKADDRPEDDGFLTVYSPFTGQRQEPLGGLVAEAYRYSQGRYHGLTRGAQNAAQAAYRSNEDYAPKRLSVTTQKGAGRCIYTTHGNCD